MRDRNVPVSLRIAGLALVLAVAACSDSTEPPRPTRIVLSVADVTLDAVGATQRLSAEVRDQNGDPLPDEEVTWSSSSTDVATVSPSGVVTAQGNGTAEITATSGSLSASASVTVRQQVTRLRKTAGDAQTDTVGQTLSNPLVVRALDRLGNPVGGEAVTFTVSSGGGSVDPESGTTDPQGRVSTSWTLGTTAGPDHRVDAAHPAVGSPASFTATAVAGPPDSVEKVRGDGQMGEAATALNDSIVVVVFDGFGNPVPGRVVQFEPLPGSGSARPDSTQTDAEGRAATEWTLGSDLNVDTLRATVDGLPPIVFTATAMLGPPADITKEAGDGQTAQVNMAVPVAPTAKVVDAGGNPVPDVEVTFTVTSGGGSVTGAVATTDASGLASVGSWTLGTAAGENTLDAQVSALSPVSFTATGTAGPPANVAKEAGDGQTTAAGADVPVSPEVKVTDGFGNPVEGVTVDFAVTSGGGSITGATPVTSTSGLAAVGSWTLGDAPGDNTLDATVTGAGTVTFTATGVAGASNIAKQAGDGQTAEVNTAVPVAPTVELTDAMGNPVQGQEVVFEVTSGGGSITGDTALSDASGLASVGSWTLGTTVGENTLTATTQFLDPVTFTATATAGPPANVAIDEGDGQTGLVGFAVNIPPAVVVTDAFGNPTPGVDVTFSVASGGGSVSGAMPTTDGAGRATVGDWTLGSTPGTNTLDASVAGVGTIFTATGAAAAYEIEVRFLSSVTTSQEQAFLDAADRWELLIFGDLPDIFLNAAAGTCGSNSPAVNETIDDLLIFATVDTIDGAGGILGQAGPCFIRTANDLPILGRMTFDAADLDNLESSGMLDEVIRHEMGHVIGLGALWDLFELLAGEKTSDPHFTGTRAIQAFDRIGGVNLTSRSKVPVENSGGSGTRDAHWEEDIFDNELMTGFLNSGSNPLSEVTTASFWDMGYLVNLDGSDDFSIPVSLRAPGGPVVLKLVNDIAEGPIYRVDSTGRVTGVVRVRP